MAEESSLEERLAEIEKENERIRVENDIFEAYLTRVNPNLAATEEAELSPSKKKKKDTKKGAAAGAAAAKQRKLTGEEKYEVLSSEIEVVTGAIEGVKTDGEKLLSEHRALLEETDLRIAETKKDTYEFKRDIVVGAENFRTGKTAAEKMIRYLEGCASAKDSMIEKLRLKNVTLKNQIQKLEQQLQQKEEMGEVLHVIDFDQLKIENQQYLEKIEERNNELLRLKLTTGKTVQVLNKLKKKLGDLTTQGEELRKDTADRKKQLANFEEDIYRVTEEKAVAEKQNKLLRSEQEDTDKPQVIEYIKLKSEVAELEKKVIDQERKIEISEMESRRLKSTTRIA